MKKLFYLFACVAAGVAAVAFTGCNDNKEEPASEIIVQSDVNVAVVKPAVRRSSNLPLITIGRLK